MKNSGSSGISYLNWNQIEIHEVSWKNSEVIYFFHNNSWRILITSCLLTNISLCLLRTDMYGKSRGLKKIPIEISDKGNQYLLLKYFIIAFLVWTKNHKQTEVNCQWASWICWAYLWEIPIEICIKMVWLIYHTYLHICQPTPTLFSRRQLLLQSEFQSMTRIGGKTRLLPNSSGII